MLTLMYYRTLQNVPVCQCMLSNLKHMHSRTVMREYGLRTLWLLKQVRVLFHVLSIMSRENTINCALKVFRQHHVNLLRYPPLTNNSMHGISIFSVSHLLTNKARPWRKMLPHMYTTRKQYWKGVYLAILAWLWPPKRRTIRECIARQSIDDDRSWWTRHCCDSRCNWRLTCASRVVSNGWGSLRDVAQRCAPTTIPGSPWSDVETVESSSETGS